MGTNRWRGEVSQCERTEARRRSSPLGMTRSHNGALSVMTDLGPFSADRESV